MARLKHNPLTFGAVKVNGSRLTGRIRDGAIETPQGRGITLGIKGMANWQDSRWRD